MLSYVSYQPETPMWRFSAPHPSAEEMEDSSQRQEMVKEAAAWSSGGGTGGPAVERDSGLSPWSPAGL